MYFNSLHFLVFFPIVVLVYYIIPKKAKQLWLLAASYYFYMCWNAKYVLLILFSTAVTYLSGRLIGSINGNALLNKSKGMTYKKLVVAGSFIINLLILFFFKYANFVSDILNDVFLWMHIDMHIPAVDVLLPVGISFYTFQALSYTMDVYREDIYPEKSFINYALFVSFFPQLVAGPIERSKNLLTQLNTCKPFNFYKFRDGFLLMIWGFFLKIVLADRIAIYVDTIYGDINAYPGWYLVVATLLFAIQIYCDFGGYSTIAMGAAEILGIELMENFNAPYLSLSVAEFWRRWHVSLSSWFKDYLYIPLGGSRKGKVRKQINKMIVFLVSGLWHGANMTYVIWGGVNGLYQVLGDVLQPVRNRVVSFFHLNTKSVGHKVFSCIVTFILIDFSWVFFRAKTIPEAIGVLKSIFNTNNIWVLLDGSLYTCGLDRSNFSLMLLSIGILLLADIWKARGVVIRKVIAAQDYWCRCLIMIFAICAILIFGVWGSGYDVAGFIYFQF